MDHQGMTATDLGRAIGAGQVDPVDLADGYLSAIVAHPMGSRIYARLMPDRAKAEALAARDRAKTGLRRGPLDGVPLSWKDLYDTAGVATEAGTRLLEGRIPIRDAAVLERATLGGSVALGKTHMSEVAFSGLGLNPMTATAPCVNDYGAVAGGSSSGAAASVAFGLAPAAIGSDTGGSVRVPAAWNDLVGFKPAHGALPLDGVVPLCLSFDTVGPLARTVQDCALVHTLLGGPATDLTGATIKGARLAIMDTITMDGVEDTPARAFAGVVDRLTAAGAHVTHITAPDLPRAYDLGFPLYGAEAYAHWRPLAEAHPDKMYPLILERLRGGASVLATDFIAGWTELRVIRQRFAALIAGYDAVICPTAPILPPQADRLASDPDHYRERNLKTLRNTRMGNLMGLTAITLPTGTPSCGIMLHALPGHDSRLLRLAHAAERALA